MDQSLLQFDTHRYSVVPHYINEAFYNINNSDLKRITFFFLNAAFSEHIFEHNTSAPVHTHRQNLHLKGSVNMLLFVLFNHFFPPFSVTGSIHGRRSRCPFCFCRGISERLPGNAYCNDCDDQKWLRLFSPKSFNVLWM